MWGIIISASSVVAQFRRGYSTTSALTYPFPPRTAVIGMIGAMLGANKKTEEGITMLKHLDKEILVGVRWVRGRIATFGINNMYGKNDGKIKAPIPGLTIWADQDGAGTIVHLPTPMEFVLYPWYEIAIISENEELIDNIETRIRAKRMAYAPYLGVQGALASIGLVMPKTEAKKVDNTVETEYTVPEPSADVYPGGRTFVAEFPRRRDYWDPLRRVTEYARIYWITPGNKVKIRPKEGVWKLNGLAIPTY